jgi:hypothetical protein
MTLVGRLGTLTGPVIGAIVVVALENKLGDMGNWLAMFTGVGWFRSLGESVTLVTGFIFIVCVLTFRRGIVGELIRHSQLASKRFGRSGQRVIVGRDGLNGDEFHASRSDVRLRRRGQVVVMNYVEGDVKASIARAE